MVNLSEKAMDIASSSQHVPKSWIDDLIGQTRKISQTELLTTENIVSSVEKYNSVFIELFVQTSLYNEPVTVLLSKAWKGTMYLMDSIIKTYQKYMGDTNETLKKVQDKLREKAHDDCYLRMTDENLVLDGALLRAQIRGLEAEVESMKISQNSYINEIHYLRIIVDEYLRSSELEDTVSRQYRTSSGFSDKTEEESNRRKQNGIEKAKNTEIIVNDSKESKKKIDNIPISHYSGSISSISEVGRHNLKILRETEEAMGEVMSCIWKEEDRQRALLQDLDKLFKQHPHTHTHPHPHPHPHPNEQSHSVSVSYSHSNKNNNNQSSSSSSRSHSHKYDTPVPTSSDNVNNSSRGSSSSSSSRHGAATTQTNIGPGFSGPTMNINKKKLRHFQDAAVQVDERDEYGTVDEAICPRSFSGPKSDGRDLDPKFPPPAFSYIEKEHSLLAEKGWNVPYKLRALMTYFPRILRIPPLDRVVQTIMAIYIRKIESDEKQNRENQNCFTLYELVYSYFTDFFGLETIADLQVKEVFTLFFDDFTICL